MLTIVVMNDGPQFYLLRAGEQYGPYSRNDLLGMAAESGLLSEDLVWCEGMANWQPVETVVVTQSRSKDVVTEQRAATPPATMIGDKSTPRKYFVPVLGAALGIVALAGAAMLFLNRSNDGIAPSTEQSAPSLGANTDGGHPQETASSSGAAPAPEQDQSPKKPFAIKGLYLGMPISEAQDIVNNGLRDTFEIYAAKRDGIRRIGLAARGQDEAGWPAYKPITKFSVQNNASGSKLVKAIDEDVGWDDDYSVVITADSQQKVDFIALGVLFTRSLFDTQNLSVSEFAEKFANGYELPEMTRGQRGWRYISDEGWGVEVADDYSIKLFRAAKDDASQFN